MKIKLLNGNAKMPTRGSDGAAGLDLYAADDAVLRRGQSWRFPLGLSIAIPYGFVGVIKPRSGLASRNSIDVLAGVVDSDFRGDLVVILINHGSQDLVILQGDRIAQLLIVPVWMGDLKQVDELPETVRGDGSFGSTGK